MRCVEVFELGELGQPIAAVEMARRAIEGMVDVEDETDGRFW